MVFIEYSVSHGPGTLIEHGVEQVKGPATPDRIDDEFAGKLRSQSVITAERYQEFLAIHGSERAV